MLAERKCRIVAGPAARLPATWTEWLALVRPSEKTVLPSRGSFSVGTEISSLAVPHRMNSKILR